MNHSIKNTIEDHDVTFDGDLIKQVNSKIALSECDERTFDVKLYAVNEGGFAVAISIDSSNPEIASVVEVELVDTADDALAVLALFEPTSHDDRRQMIDEMGKTAFDGQCRRLDRTFRNAMDQALLALDEYKEVHPDCEVTEKPESDETAGFVNRILNSIGLW